MFEAEIKYLATGPLPEFGPCLGEVVSRDTYFDTPDGRFYASGRELRLRQSARETVLTAKGPPFDAPTGSKEEWETAVADAAAMEAILTGLGFVVKMTYAKRRRLFAAGAEGRSLSIAVATVDFSPHTFVEIEHLAPDRASGLAALETIRRFAAGLGLVRECPACYTDLFLTARADKEHAPCPPRP